MAPQVVPERPMQARYEDGAESRRLNKKVLDSRLPDSMEDHSNWSFTGAGEMTLTDVPVKRAPRISAEISASHPELLWPDAERQQLPQEPRHGKV